MSEENWYLEDESDDDETAIEETIDTCVCSECRGTFELGPHMEASECPICGVKFDGRGG